MYGDKATWDNGVHEKQGHIREAVMREYWEWNAWVLECVIFMHIPRMCSSLDDSVHKLTTVPLKKLQSDIADTASTDKEGRNLEHSHDALTHKWVL